MGLGVILEWIDDTKSDRVNNQIFTMTIKRYFTIIEEYLLKTKERNY